MKMEPSKRTLVILASFLGAVGLMGVHQYQEGVLLRAELAEDRGGVGEDQRGEPRLSRAIGREREKTVGSLYAGIRGGLSARDLVRMATLEGDYFQQHLAALAITGASLEDLMRWRVELNKLDLFQDKREWLEDLICIGERKFVEKDPRGVFDQMIGGNFQVNPRTAKYFANWVSADPENARAWFREVDQGPGFGGESVYRRSNREKMFAGLIEGMAEKEMDRAIELFLREGDGWTPSKRAAASRVAPGILKHAIESGDDMALLDLMKTISFVQSTGVSGEDVLRDFVKRSGDLDRGIDLLKSMSPYNLGAGMAVLAESQDGLSFQEKMEWMRERISDPGQYDQGVLKYLLDYSDHKYSSIGFAHLRELRNPFEINEAREHINRLEKGEQRDAGVEVLTRAYASKEAFQAGFEFAQTTSDEGLRDELSRRIAREWVTKDPEGAAAALPEEYLKGGTE